jgi:N-acetylglucosamine kinase-like BadF-type ATPase
MAPTYVFGGDVGRTKISLFLVSEHALSLGIRTERRSDDFVSTLRCLASSLLEEHRIKCAELAVLGVAGCWTDDERRAVESEFRRSGPLGRVEVVSDAEIAHYGALSGRPGIAVIAGTGSIALGRDSRDRWVRAGGHGHVLGDEGSGFALGRDALLAGVRFLEGRGPRTALWRLLDTRSPESARSRLIELSREAPSSVAGLAPRVIRAAQRGDDVALSIVERATENLALLCGSVRQRGEFEDRHEIRTCGGLFKSRFFSGSFKERVEGTIEGARVAHSERTPAYGAGLLALEKLGFIRLGHLR